MKKNPAKNGTAGTKMAPQMAALVLHRLVMCGFVCFF